MAIYTVWIEDWFLNPSSIQAKIVEMPTTKKVWKAFCCCHDNSFGEPFSTWVITLAHASQPFARHAISTSKILRYSHVWLKELGAVQNFKRNSRHLFFEHLLTIISAIHVFYSLCFLNNQHSAILINELING